MNKERVLVAMPAYNEEKYIGSLVVLARKYADTVVVIDDGSTDATGEAARLAGAEVFRHEAREGKGVAVQRIFQEAKARSFDIMVLLDADFQHLPHEIPLVMEPIRKGYDVSIGSRTAQARSTPRLRRAGQKALGMMSQVATGLAVTDSESGFRAFSRRAVEALELSEKGFAIENEMLVQASAKGLSITEVPISNVYTSDGSTLNPVRHGFSVLNRVIAMISERRPLLFFGSLGGVFLIIGVILGVSVIQSYFFESSVLATGTALLTILFVTIGLLSVFTGLILNVLISRISGK